MEYIYTDHCPIEEGDGLGILALADRFGLTRLVTLCELYITKWIDENTRVDITTSDVDVVSILEHAERHNAGQLADFCRHFLASNYTQVVSRPDFDQLSKKNREFVEKHQWPPKSYYEALRTWQKVSIPIYTFIPYHY